MSFSSKSVFATLPRTQRGQPIVLGGDPKGENFLYTNGHSIIIRNLENPAICDIYTEHSHQTTVAKYSPSRFYIASGDVSGKIRIWDTTQKEHILKNEFQPLGGTIKDIAWSPDSQRIVVAGEGREKFGHVFIMDTGTSVGEINGHSKFINSVDYKPTRPFRIATASEDTSIGFFQGPPFKFVQTMNDHSRFAQAVRYSPTGELFISAGADGKMFIYDGKDGSLKAELGSPAHKGGIYALSFSGDGKHILSVSGDKTAKVWDVDQGQVVTEWTLGKNVDDMQVGCLWQGNYLLSVSLSGHINYLDQNDSSKPSRIIKGHNKPVTAMTIDQGTIYTGGSDGKICYWDAQTGNSDIVEGKGHSNQIQEMAVSDGQLVTCSMDDSVMFTSVNSKQYGNQVKLDSQPKGVAAAPGGLTIVACINEVVVFRNGNKMSSTKVSSEAKCVTIHPSQGQVAVGSSDSKVHVYNLSGDTLTECNEFDQSGEVTDVKYSSDGAYLATCDSNKKVVYYTVPDYVAQVKTDWGAHAARVTKVSWAPDSGHLGSCSLDTTCVVWTPGEKRSFIQLKGAHPMSHATSISWVDPNTMVSCGHDGNIKQWNIMYQ